MTRVRAATAVFLLFTAAIQDVDAATVTLGASKDNTLYEDPTGSLSNGVGVRFFTGKTGDGYIRRALVAFDVAGSVPAGATITNVTLRLNMSKTTAPAETVELHRVLADWGEGASDAGANEGSGIQAASGDATWVHTFYNTSFWTNVGGDFSATVSATQSVAGVGFYTWGSTPEMVADVQSWLNSPSTNFGWVVVGNEIEVHTAKRFDSRNHTTANNRPALTITYTPAVAPVINAIADAGTLCGTPYTSATPTLAQGSPLPTWSLVTGQNGMTINVANGAVSWPNPPPNETPYGITVMATNAAGSDTESWQLTVKPGDFTGDGVGDDADIPIFVDHLLGNQNSRPCAADLNLDTFIDGLDVLAFVAGI